MLGRAVEILRRFGDGPIVGVEVGVWTGKLSAELLSVPNLKLYMVDTWQGSDMQPASYIASGDILARMSHAEQAECKRQALHRTWFASDRRVIIQADSVDAAQFLVNEQADFVFIDADHSYEGVTRDIMAWKDKVKAGGWLCGHDYENTDGLHADVKRAVTDAAERYGWQVELGQDFTWFVRL